MAHGDARQWEIERAMRAHPAGSAPRRDRPRGPGVVPAVEAVTPPRLPVRLTARGRRLLAVLTVAAGLGLTSIVGTAVGGGHGGSLHLAGQSSVVVHSGDTLWSVASSVAGDQDVRAVVDRIRQVNGLRGSELQPGQVLVLP